MTVDSTPAAKAAKQPSRVGLLGHIGDAFPAIVAGALAVAAAFVARARPQFEKFDPDHGFAIWVTVLVLVLAYPAFFLLRVNWTRHLLLRAFQVVLLCAGLALLLAWALWYQNRPEWYFSGYLALLAAVCLWVFPLYRASIRFRNDYVPFILGHAVYSEPDANGAIRCTSKKWVHYRAKIFWILMVPVSLLLFLVTLADAMPAGWTLLVYALAWMFTRKVVEEDTDSQNDLLPLAMKLFVLFATCVVIVALFGTEPLKLFDEGVRYFNNTVSGKFYLVSAGFFLLIVLTEVVGAWLTRRTESDGQYLELMSVIGRANRIQLFVGRVSDREGDVWEALLGAWRFTAESGGKIIVHQVIFFGQGLDTLFAVGSTANANTQVNAEEARQPGHHTSGESGTSA